MAHTTANHTAPVSLNARLAAYAAAFRAYRTRRAVYKRTFAELAALSDREMADLDLDRASIRYLAREAANRA